MSGSQPGPGLILVGGGVRSGKSRFAEGLSERLGQRRLYVATATPGEDPEMASRIERHRQQRGDGFSVIEEPRTVPEVLLRAAQSQAPPEVALIDCMTLWLTNLLLSGREPERIESRVRALVQAARSTPFPVVVVTNEVGLGIVPEHPLGRTFRDLAGRAHQILADEAEAVFFAALGCVLRFEPAPVERVARNGSGALPWLKA